MTLTHTLAWAVIAAAIITLLWDVCGLSLSGGRRRLREWYRIARGRCILCNGKASAHREGPWIYPLKYGCGWCNKRIQHGMNYGASMQTMREEKCQ